MQTLVVAAACITSRPHIEHHVERRLSSPAEAGESGVPGRLAQPRLAALIAEGKTLQQTIDAKPTADFDQGRLGGNITPERFTTLVYTDLARRAGK
jgi:hypothetical protein